MLRATGQILWILLLVVGVFSSQARGDDAGQEDLDKATQTKISASALTDLNEVVRLCESALKKGLNEENTAFANQLLSSTLIQRGALVANAIFDSFPPNPRWADFRRVALEDLERAVKLDAKQPEAFYLIARLNQLPNGDEKRAKEALDLAIQTSADNPPLRSKILVLRATTEEDNEKRLADLEEAIRIAPGDASPLRTRGLLYTDQHENEKALADFNAALELEADHVPTLEAKLNLLVEMKRYDEALTVTARLRELQPDSVAPLVQEARVQALQGNLEAAIHNLDRAEQMEPNNARVLWFRGLVHHQADQNDKALADAERALQLSPGLEPAVRLRAALLAGSGKLDMAIEQLNELLKTAPDDVESRLQLGVLYHVNKRPRKAIEIFSEVLKVNPENTAALQLRADALLSVGKHAEAIADYEKFLQQNADDSNAMNNLAWVLATSPVDELRNGKRAIELATKACELTEYKQANILSTLGAAYAETGDFETAKKWSGKAIELGDEDDKEALKKEMETYEAGKPVREMKTAPEETEEAPQETPAPKAEPTPPPAEEPKAEPKENPEEGPKLLPPQDAQPIRL
jgi:tetratricopeptide (TPR) repeat protein